MKKMGIGLIGLLFSINVMAQCTKKTDKEFLAIYNNPPYDVAKLEKLSKSCNNAPVEMLLHFAKGEAHLRKGEVEFAYEEYRKARYKYGDISGNQIAMYQSLAEILEEKIEKYAPKTADEITRSMREYRGADLTIEYKIEELPLNFQSDSADIKEGVNLKQAKEIYKVLSSSKYRGKKIRIIGYTDTSGESNHNFELSEKRAISLANYLKRRGVTNEIASSGQGESKPICTKGEPVSKKNYEFECSIKEDKYRSRRVEITIGDN